MTPRLDIRWPIGMLWVVLGALLGGYGLGAQRTVGPSLAIDRWWGATMVVFGLAMLFGARAHDRRSRRAASASREDPRKRNEQHTAEEPDATDERG